VKSILAAGLTMVLCWAGCATAPRTGVSLVNVRFTQATAFETTAVFTLRFNNETPEPLQINGGVHKIYLNDHYVGEGLSHEPLELPRFGSVTQTVTVHLSNLRLVARLKPIIESQSFDYRLRSVLHSGAGRIRTGSEGRLDARDFQPTPAGAGR
jgi:LEA14-like dessication related protein